MVLFYKCPYLLEVYNVFGGLFFLGHAMQLVGSQFTDQGLNPSHSYESLEP